MIPLEKRAILAQPLSQNTPKSARNYAGADSDTYGSGAASTIHRQVIRIIEYLDGVTSASTSGDLPPGSPLLVDPTTGRIGLLELQPTQLLPGYLAHVDIHLQGLANAPGHTQTQQALASKLDHVLKLDTSLFQLVRQEVVLQKRVRNGKLGLILRDVRNSWYERCNPVQMASF